mmetsp:Transcript_129870/g.277256  ORF Transcript_129870/g.277256 Transcript_129870/m.277256 type:complete len:158 (+) Transcript_129870:64-537(+)
MEHSSSYTYLPHPFPAVRGTGAHGSFFNSLHEPCRPAEGNGKPICPNTAFTSYGAWWQAHQPSDVQEKPAVSLRASAFWPYGKSVTVANGSTNKCDAYALDGRTLNYTLPHQPPAPPAGGERGLSGFASPTLRRAGSAAALLGGPAESTVRGKSRNW